jgi:hypothetical protein
MKKHVLPIEKSIEKNVRRRSETSIGGNTFCRSGKGLKKVNKRCVDREQALKKALRDRS